jgi:hypothetical protein
MDTDYAVPTEVDRIRARVSKVLETDSGSEETETWRDEFAVVKNSPGEPGVYRLPATFGVLAKDDADLDREIIIELEALTAGGTEALVKRRVKTSFVPGEARLVRMVLFRACADMACSAEQSCGCPGSAPCSIPECIDESLRPKDLEVIDNPGMLPPNAGIPGAPGPDEPDDGGINCKAPLLVCGTDCVNPKADPRYCGDCATSCPSGHVCEGGDCLDPGDCRSNGVGCSGFSYCDPSSGECLPGCSASEQCAGNNEVCDTANHECVCAGGFERCEETCADTQSNPAFCGDCGTSCQSGQVCEDGSCFDPGDCRTNGVGCSGFSYCDPSSGACLPGCSSSEQCGMGNNEVCDKAKHECVCAASFDPCEGGCVDTQSNPDFCGDCGTSCPTGHLCEGGACVNPADCRTNGVGCSGFSYCDPSSGECLPGCAVSTQCAGTNEICDTAKHECVCSAEFQRCGALCVPPDSVDFCGPSCSPCPAAPAHATRTCNQGSCDFLCDEGYGRCEDKCCRCDTGNPPQVCDEPTP